MEGGRIYEGKGVDFAFDDRIGGFSLIDLYSEKTRWFEKE